MDGGSFAARRRLGQKSRNKTRWVGAGGARARRLAIDPRRVRSSRRCERLVMMRFAPFPSWVRPSAGFVRAAEYAASEAMAPSRRRSAEVGGLRRPSRSPRPSWADPLPRPWRPRRPPLRASRRRSRPSRVCSPARQRVCCRAAKRAPPKNPNRPASQPDANSPCERSLVVKSYDTAVVRARAHPSRASNGRLRRDPPARGG